MDSFFPLTHNQCVNAFNTVVAKDELFYIYESQWDQVENRPVLPWSILVAFFWSVVVDQSLFVPGCKLENWSHIFCL